ncbi:MAG TPA: glycoside hydrolase family 88 protein, partial [Halanaerobiales bacterium]|nr:glycoside hydrolase family 88 protein [Halanaerobiales bacterium]
LVNHLGNSPEGKFYPISIWVDSLMMFSVFPTIYAIENNDKELLDFAARQPGVYAKYLQDKEKKLWYHSYWIKRDSPYPAHLFWGRGNGWVVTALPVMLDYLPVDHQEREKIIQILKSTSEALMDYQREDGYFETILNHPGKTYREASATALIASGWLHGVRCGYLDNKYQSAAVKALEAVINNLKYENEEVYMPEISGPTIPLPLFPYLGYRFVPRRENYPYGIAALIFAAIEYSKGR